MPAVLVAPNGEVRRPCALKAAERGQSEVAVIFVDLDNFKHVNDSLGHLVGDQLLKSVAHKLGSCLRGGDVLEHNFDSYEIPRFSWMPKIETVLIENPSVPAAGGGGTAERRQPG